MLQRQMPEEACNRGCTSLGMIAVCDREPIERYDALPQKDQASLADISRQTAQMLHPDRTSPSLCHEDFWDYLQPITDVPIEARLSQAAWTAAPTLCLTSPSHNVCLAALLYCSRRLCASSGRKMLLAEEGMQWCEH